MKAWDKHSQPRHTQTGLRKLAEGRFHFQSPTETCEYAALLLLFLSRETRLRGRGESSLMLKRDCETLRLRRGVTMQRIAGGYIRAGFVFLKTFCFHCLVYMSDCSPFLWFHKPMDGSHSFWPESDEQRWTAPADVGQILFPPLLGEGVLPFHVSPPSV